MTRPEVLFKAIQSGDVEQVRQLLAAGADPNADVRRHTPLSAALNNVEIVRRRAPWRR